jgi:hypothetical protein
MSQEKKTISINPQLFQLSKKNRTMKKDNKIKPVPIISPNILKKNLLQKIKDHQNEQNKVSESTLKSNSKDSIINNAFSEEFKNSISYLSNLINKNNNKKTLKKHSNENTQSPPILDNSFEDNLISNTPMINTNLNNTNNVMSKPLINVNTPSLNTPSLNTPSLNTPSLNTPNKFNTIENSIQHIAPIITTPPNIINNVIEPPYGCLKNAIKPTYRSWLRHTQKNKGNHLENDLNIQDNINQNNIPREDKLMQIQNNFKENIIPDKPINCLIKKTIRKKYKLGKSKKKRIISILIKGSNFRKKISNEKHKLTKKNINTVKSYLKKHGLLKSGSSCPNDILRKMYEDSILTGYVTNKNKDTLIHNFLNL